MDARSVRRLTIYFIGWKLLLLMVVVCSPGPGYDTSTTLLSAEWSQAAEAASRNDVPESTASTILSIISHNLVRWDSIYFVNIAERGYLFEQEWAFGYGYTRSLSMLSPGKSPGVIEIAWVGVALSHLCHYMSVLSLYAMSKKVFGEGHPRMAFLSATLHIICPAGAFLSAPYGEALFSFLNFMGFYLYASALFDDDGDGTRSRALPRDVKLLAAGIFFGAATTVRSNGVLSGILFAYDALANVAGIAQNGVSLSTLRRLFFVFLGGSFVAVGMAAPQYIAYTEYCQSPGIRRSWCDNLFPSIYAWVQNYYWDVGLFKYWTVSNIPLFILAAPMLLMLASSSSWALLGTAAMSPGVTGSSQKKLQQACLTRFALPQAILTAMALAGYHVQIITRLSSGYPLWYWFLSSHILSADDKSGRVSSSLFSRGAFVRGMVLYAVVQGALFGSFLPPA